MINCFSVSVKKLKRGNSMVPEFYYYDLIVKEKNIKKGIKYIKIEEFKVSDGEHTAIPRNSNCGIRYLYGRNIREGCVDFDPISDESYIDEENYNSIKRVHLFENDVLIPIVGTIGKSAIYKKAYIGIAGIPRHIAHITIDDCSEITPEYLSVFFRSKYGKVQLYSLTTGNIQPLLSLTNLKTVEIPVLDRNIIKKITENEEEANRLLIKSNEKLNEAKELFYESLGFEIRKVKGNLSCSITSKDVFSNDIWTPKQYGLLYENINKEIVNRFHVERLDDILSESFHGVEVGSNNYNEYLDKESTDIPFIRTSDIVNNSVDLYPDFYINEDIYANVKQNLKNKDVIFTKDGKIGSVGMIMENDNCILASGIQIMRLNEYAKSNGITQEYLFIALSTKEIGYYEAIRRTVVASTIPHLRPERMNEITIPVISKEKIDIITQCVSEAFRYKNQRIPLLKENDNILEKAFIII
ncbi:MAG: restriction endonuclease subunit S [Clostridia bacterium]|nr:restriction endonuclease subunit S [Clostridia bacterium]